MTNTSLQTVNRVKTGTRMDFYLDYIGKT